MVIFTQKVAAFWATGSWKNYSFNRLNSVEVRSSVLASTKIITICALMVNNQDRLQTAKNKLPGAGKKNNYLCGIEK